ncbi:MAG TPA: plastocyanin/azurin family copper-binding protein [Chitinophaga sp.]|nr:plastocyanin/azurin family copper-binding protein [Chitinophaga sp.]
MYLVIALLALIGPGNGVKTVKMEGMRFSPKKIEISVGDTVVWVNGSNMPHNVISDDGVVVSSLMKKGETFLYVFRKAGTFPYYCQPHRSMGMKGTVIVK